jgi:hypothetical protein
MKNERVVRGLVREEVREVFSDILTEEKAEKKLPVQEMTEEDRLELLDLLETDPRAIMYINHPDDEMIVTAVSNDLDLFKQKRFANISDDLKMQIIDAVKYSWQVFEKIPAVASPEVIKYCVEKYPDGLRHMNKKHYEKLSVDDVKEMIRIIRNAGEDVPKAAIEYLKTKDPLPDDSTSSADDIQIEEIKRLMEKNHGSLPFDFVRRLVNPSEKVQMAIVMASPFSIASLKNPTQAVMQKAVELQPYVISDIKNPPVKLVIYARRKMQEIETKQKAEESRRNEYIFSRESPDDEIVDIED